MLNTLVRITSRSLRFVEEYARWKSDVICYILYSLSERRRTLKKKELFKKSLNRLLKIFFLFFIFYVYESTMQQCTAPIVECVIAIVFWWDWIVLGGKRIQDFKIRRRYCARKTRFLINNWPRFSTRRRFVRSICSQPTLGQHLPFPVCRGTIYCSKVL